MKCRQCGFEIIEGGRQADVEAQQAGYCGEGCRDVSKKLNEWNSEAAKKEESIHGYQLHLRRRLF